MSLRMVWRLLLLLLSRKRAQIFLVGLHSPEQHSSCEHNNNNNNTTNDLGARQARRQVCWYSCCSLFSFIRSSFTCRDLLGALLMALVLMLSFFTCTNMLFTQNGITRRIFFFFGENEKQQMPRQQRYGRIYTHSIWSAEMVALVVQWTTCLRIKNSKHNNNTETFMDSGRIVSLVRLVFGFRFDTQRKRVRSILHLTTYFDICPQDLCVQFTEETKKNAWFTSDTTGECTKANVNERSEM